jgi:DnaA family protein
VSPQIPLALKFPPDQQLDAFVGQPQLRAALAAIAAGESHPEAGDWLYLAGPQGSGKSHLLLAACAQARSLGRSASYLPLADLAGHLQDMLLGQDSAGLTCLDGLEAIAGNGEDEVALFHFHNATRQAGGRLLYAASAMPTSLGLHLPDLVSRLEQCTRLALEPPDESARREILRARAARRGLELDDAVLDFVFRRVGRDLASLTALLDRLDRASLASQRRITVPFVRSVIEAA